MELRTIDAIRSALEVEMVRDERVTVLGEDVTVGGPFGATKGLLDAFGPRRVRDTPISEGTVVGMATGAALSGQRPVVEVMFIDFVTLAMDQLVNHAAKLRYMSGGLLSVPLVIRAQGGAQGAMAAHHSQSLEAWLTHVPGLKVVAPSTPADAYGLLAAAIRDDDPVVFLEHRALYWVRGEVPLGGVALATGDDAARTPGDDAARTPGDDAARTPGDDAALVPLGSATVARPGRDITVVSWSRTVTTALAAAETLAAEGIEAEVLDLRSLAPLDLDLVLASVARTGCCLVAHEAVMTAGFGAEVAARVGEAAWSELRAPVTRVAAPFAPVPFSPELERLFVPDAEAIAAAVRRVVGTAPGVAA